MDASGLADHGWAYVNLDDWWEMNNSTSAHVAERKAYYGAVCVEGPKWCGKTWLAQHQAASACMIADPTDNFATRGRVDLDINYAFQGARPHLIDEWQEFPALWDATRFHVDQSAEQGQYILTGSSVPKVKGVMHICREDAEGWSELRWVLRVGDKRRRLKS